MQSLSQHDLAPHLHSLITHSHLGAALEQIWRLSAALWGTAKLVCTKKNDKVSLIHSSCPYFLSILGHFYIFIYIHTHTHTRHKVGSGDGCVSCWDTDLGLCGLSVCPPLKHIAQPGGRDAPASPSLLTDSPAVETSSHPITHTASTTTEKICSFEFLTARLQMKEALWTKDTGLKSGSFTGQLQWTEFGSGGDSRCRVYTYRKLCVTWASLTSSCLYLLTMSLVRFSRKPDTVSNSWSTVRRETSSQSHFFSSQ